MNAPLIWVGVPAAAGVVFWFLRRRPGRVVVFASLLCLALALMAWLAPFGQSVRVGPLSLSIETTFTFAGRRLVLEASDRTFLVFIYFACAFWFAGSFAAGSNELFIPFSLEIVALLVAALAVEPFLYAALLVEMAVLVAIPMLAPPGTRIGQGVLRFLIFQTLAMPFILLAGWALAGVESNPSNQTLVILSGIFLSLGFAFWLAVFPFYTWIPMLAEQSNPYVSGFIFLLLLTINLLLGLNFLSSFGWLRASMDIFRVISQIGTLMVVAAGVWAAFQQDLSRLFGYGVIVETGFSMLAIGLGGPTGMQLFSSMFIPRMLGLGLWALSLSILQSEAGSTRFEDVRGLAQRMPFAASGLAVAALTLGGLPLLPVFPVHQALLEELAKGSLFNALWVLVGSGAMLFSTFRALIVLAHGTLLPQMVRETRMQTFLLVGGIISLLLTGLFPKIFLTMLSGLTSGYSLIP